MPSLKTITIFIASSGELREERDAFRLFIAGLNDKFVEKHIYLKIIQWERFLDAISNTRLQDEYNNALKETDIALCLFFTKVGKFSEEEFDTAYSAFKATGKPKIWTYFKNAAIATAAITDEITTLLQFKRKLREYGHFFTEYTSTADLHNKFRDQLDIILPDLILPVGKKRTITAARNGNPSPVASAYKEAGDQKALATNARQDSSHKTIDEIDGLLDEPTEENIKTAIDLMGKLTKNTAVANFMLPLKAEWLQYQENKLAGFNMTGRLAILLVRLNNIIKEYKKTNR